jgi:hypothetical protein
MQLSSRHSTESSRLNFIISLKQPFRYEKLGSRVYGNVKNRLTVL